jgi:hypothetical protein
VIVSSGQPLWAASVMVWTVVNVVVPLVIARRCTSTVVPDSTGSQARLICVVKTGLADSPLGASRPNPAA